VRCTRRSWHLFLPPVYCRKADHSAIIGSTIATARSNKLKYAAPGFPDKTSAGAVRAPADVHSGIFLSQQAEASRHIDNQLTVSSNIEQGYLPDTLLDAALL
jgi:hypothetical protein